MDAASEPAPGSVVASAVIGGLSPAQRLDPAPLLLVVAELEHRLGEEAARGDQVADPGAAPAQLLLDDAAGEQVGHAAAAVLLGEHERGEAELGRLVPDLPRRLDVRLVDRQGDRADLVLRELAADRLDLPLLRRQLDDGSGHDANPSRSAVPGTGDRAALPSLPEAPFPVTMPRIAVVRPAPGDPQAVPLERGGPGRGRVLELDGHPFFPGTPFLPQARSTPAEPHPVLRGFAVAAEAAQPG